MTRPLLSRVRALLVQTVVTVVATTALLEGLVVWSFRAPQLSPLPRTVVRQMHVLFDRNTIQVMPECAIYDPALTYTLKPGRCTFSNREFTTEVAVNRLGVRDDDRSLEAPSIVVLGDSVAMGWGVEESAAFPSVVERLSRRRTLNAGVSSYGTVRELKMLDRLDRRDLIDLIVQHSSNDLPENEQFLDGRFSTLSAEAYARTVRDHAEMRQYHPGKHSLNLLAMLRNLARERNAPPPRPSREREARAFLGVLAASPVDLSPYRLTVLTLEPGFREALQPLALASPVTALRALQVVDLTELANQPGTYFVLDDHPTARGHEAIGVALAAAIASPVGAP